MIRVVTIFGAVFVVGATWLYTPPAAAIGCLSGAAVGGVAGHVAGHHGVIGAIAGCAIGHHEATVEKRRQDEEREAVERAQTERLNDAQLRSARGEPMPAGGKPPPL